MKNKTFDIQLNFGSKGKTLRMSVTPYGEVQVSLGKGLRGKGITALASKVIVIEYEKLAKQAKTNQRTIWSLAQEELARQLLALTSTENGEIVSQKVQADKLGLDRAYISRLRKRFS